MLCHSIHLTSTHAFPATLAHFRAFMWHYLLPQLHCASCLAYFLVVSLSQVCNLPSCGTDGAVVFAVAGSKLHEWKKPVMQRTSDFSKTFMRNIAGTSSDLSWFLMRDATQSVVMLRVVVHPSIRLSVCDIQVPWSYRLEFLENSFTAE